MAKQLNSKELGIPSGYRLSDSNCNNILNVSIRQKFGEEIMKLAWREADLMMCVSAEAYSSDALHDYVKLCSKITGIRNNRERFISLSHQIDIMLGSGKFQLGGNYRSYGQDGGITTMDVFEKLINNMTNQEFENEFGIKVRKHVSNHFIWSDNFCVMIEPSDLLINSIPIQKSRLSTKTFKSIKKFKSDLDKFRKKIEKHIELIKSILAVYTSSVKLCNDMPEMIEYINNASIFNSHGKKCSDLSTIDMIAQLRKVK